jgi:hypothetical protein
VDSVLTLLLCLLLPAPAGEEVCHQEDTQARLSQEDTCCQEGYTQECCQEVSQEGHTQERKEGMSCLTLLLLPPVGLVRRQALCR